MDGVIRGDKELRDALNQIGTKQAESIMRGAFRRVARPLVKTMKANLKPHDRTKNLRRSIGTAAIRGRVGITIGARTFGRYKGYAGFILNDGTKNRFTHKGAYRGRMGSSNFFTKAISVNETKVLASLNKEFRDSIQRYIDKADRRRKT